MNDHMSQCKTVLEAVKRVLRTVSPENITNEVKLCRLSSVLRNQSAGQNGAGLTGGQQQESLWVDMLTLGDVRFTIGGDIKIDDADYYFQGYPISHKTIGWTGPGDLALAWSKNPFGGLQRTEFKASVAIALTRKPAGGKWQGIQNGYYIVPLDFLKDNIVFSSNNKTDSLIKANQVISAIRYADRSGLMVPLAYDHEWGRGKYLSYWGAGLNSVIGKEK